MVRTSVPTHPLGRPADTLRAPCRGRPSPTRGPSSSRPSSGTRWRSSAGSSPAASSPSPSPADQTDAEVGAGTVQRPVSGNQPIPTKLGKTSHLTWGDRIRCITGSSCYLLLNVAFEGSRFSECMYKVSLISSETANRTMISTLFFFFLPKLHIQPLVNFRQILKKPYKKAQSSYYVGVCLRWQTKPRHDKPPNTKNIWIKIRRLNAF